MSPSPIGVEFVATPRSVVISPRADGVEVELSITPLAEGLLKVTACNTAFLCGVVWCVV